MGRCNERRGVVRRGNFCTGSRLDEHKSILLQRESDAFQRFHSVRTSRSLSRYTLVNKGWFHQDVCNEQADNVQYRYSDYGLFVGYDRWGWGVVQQQCHQLLNNSLTCFVVKETRLPATLPPGNLRWMPLGD